MAASTFLKHLATLNSSSQKIESVSKYMRIKVSDAAVLSAAWLDTILNPSTSRERLLPLIYLASDVMMKPGDSASVYSKELESLLPNALHTVAKRSLDSVPRLHRMLGIWKDGQKFKEDSLTLMKEQILAGEADALATAPLSSTLKASVSTEGSVTTLDSELIIYLNDGQEIESADSSSVNGIIEGSSLSALLEAQRRLTVTKSVLATCANALSRGADYNIALNLANSSAKPSVEASQRALSIVSTAEKGARLALACARINHYRRQATLAKLTEAIDVQSGKLGQIEIDKYEEIEVKLRSFLEAQASGQVIRERGRVMTSDVEVDNERDAFIIPSAIEPQQNVINSNQATKKRTLADMKLRYAATTPVVTKSDSVQDAPINEPFISLQSDQSLFEDRSHAHENDQTISNKKARLAIVATGGAGREGSAAAVRKTSPKSTVGTFMTLSLPQTRFFSVSNGASLVKTSVGGVIDPSLDSKNKRRVDTVDDDDDYDEDNDEPVEADADAGFNLQSVDDVFAGRRWDGVRKEWVVDES